ncbi:hypothetical protein [Salinimonas chungwhensis]|uniref:hypothetical protein n=1 Tax=Salinimonas chungwhensis TaxID=265425 RepID=UPI0003750B93|nr:hypothetical protein [Salinimonas chungwhensis]
MRKLTLCAAAVTALVASASHAGPGDVQLVGYVSPVCEVSGLNTQLLDFGDVTSSHQSVNIGMHFKCNDVDGATVTLISAEGGLESDDDEDFALTYDAVFTPTGLTPLTLNAPGGPGQNDVPASQIYGGSSALASGVGASLVVTTTEAATWAGGYSDTLTVNVTSN